MAKLKLREIKQYVFADPKLKDNTIARCAKWVGKLMVAYCFIDAEDIQYTKKKKVDWVATVNDVLATSDITYLRKLYKQIIKEYENN